MGNALEAALSSGKPTPVFGIVGLQGSGKSTLAGQVAALAASRGLKAAVEVVADAEADAYFASRPRLSQIGAWASHQSETLVSREAFEALIAQVEKEYEGRDVPRPQGWGGYRVIPDALEFWYGAQFRLHERWRYERDAGGAWSKRMLFP